MFKNLGKRPVIKLKPIDWREIKGGHLGILSNGWIVFTISEMDNKKVSLYAMSNHVGDFFSIEDAKIAAFEGLREWVEELLEENT